MRRVLVTTAAAVALALAAPALAQTVNDPPPQDPWVDETMIPDYAAQVPQEPGPPPQAPSSAAGQTAEADPLRADAAQIDDPAGALAEVRIDLPREVAAIVASDDYTTEDLNRAQAEAARNPD